MNIEVDQVVVFGIWAFSAVLSEQLAFKICHVVLLVNVREKVILFVYFKYKTCLLDIEVDHEHIFQMVLAYEQGLIFLKSASANCMLDSLESVSDG